MYNSSCLYGMRGIWRGEGNGGREEGMERKRGGEGEGERQRSLNEMDKINTEVYYLLCII